MIDANAFRTIADLARLNAHVQPGRIAFHFEGVALSYGALDQNSSRTANGLIQMAVAPGDRVAYLGKNSANYFELLLGVAKAGAVMCPINWRPAPSELAWILRECEAKVLFIGPEFADLACAQHSLFANVRNIICSEGPAAGLPGYEEWRDANCTTDPQINRGDDDAVLQMYSSGTTGRPKGAVLTNGSILRTQLDHGPAALQE